MIHTDIEIAEIGEICDNAWHALKVASATRSAPSPRRSALMAIRSWTSSAATRRLNISPKYLKPGFSFGGSCLPKDLRALTYRARRLDLDLPILTSVIPSNERHTSSGFRMIAEQGHRRVGVLA